MAISALLAASAAAQGPPQPEAAGLTSPRLTLNLRGVDVVDVLKLLSEHSGLNFVVGREVAGPVTLYVKDVGVWDALELLASSNNLAYERQGGVVSVMTGQEYERRYGDPFLDRRRTRVFTLRYAKAAQVAGLLEQLKSAVGHVAVGPANTLVASDAPVRLDRLQQAVEEADRPTTTRIFALRYAEAATVKEQLAPFLTAGTGVATVDERTNQLAVTDVPDVLAALASLVRAFDERTRAVLIEAKIVQVTLQDDWSLGIDWQGVFREAQTRARARFTTLGDVLGGLATGGVFSFTTGGGDNVAVLVDAIQQVGRTEILSSPRIAATDRQEAKILVGTKEAFVTTTTITPGGGGPVTATEQVTFVDVGVKLYVTPVIRRDGWVSLKIRPEVSSVERQLETAQRNQIPIVRTSEAETQILARDGTTIIIAGLIEDRHERSRRQIPLLGSLPLVGGAFGNRTRAARKTETVIFLTPHILPGGGDAALAAFQPASRARTRAIETAVQRAQRAAAGAGESH